MANGVSKFHEFSAISDTLAAAWNSEPCDKFAKRAVAENRTKLNAKDISLPQALGYLQRLQEMTHIYGDTQCSSIVGFDYGMLLGRLAVAKP